METQNGNCKVATIQPEAKVKPEKFSIQDLCDRYNLTRPQVYVRRKKLAALGVNVEFKKENGKSYLPENLIDAFDQQNEWLNRQGTLDNFTLTLSTEIVEDSQSEEKSTEIIKQQPLDDYRNGTEDLAIAIAEAFKSQAPVIDPFFYIDRLIFLAEQKIQITTKEVKQLIGVTPEGNNYKRGSFTFVKIGKIGRYSGWIVKRSDGYEKQEQFPIQFPIHN